MSQITRCPNCATTFRVSDAQLAAFQGKVRCGKCAFIFHAPDNMVLPEMPPPPQVPEEESQLIKTNIETPAPPPFEQEETEIVISAEEEAIEVPAMVFSTPATPPSPIEAPASPEDYHPIPLIEDDEFLSAPKPSSKWWLIPVSLTIALLLLQIIYAARTRITMELPGLRPQFVAACQMIGCSVPLPRRSELLRSEWSELTFVPDHPNLVQLSATLRNLAPFEQALPLLQLTLTDEQENVVARRIFRPSEYLTATERKRTQLAIGDELHAYLQLDLGPLRSTGYSLFWIHE